jgi:hypothetical protein
MIDETLAGKMLAGLRGQPPADKNAVAQILVAVSHQMAANDAIAEIDLNPVVVYDAGHGAVAVDVRIIRAA